MVNQRDIAARLGISQAHVSMALAGSPRVAADLRAEVVRLAEELGYRPDAIAAGLADRRWRDRRRPACQTLAWIGGRGHVYRATDPYLPHVREQAEALGHTLLEWWADDFADDAALLAALQQRKIGGMLLSEPHTPNPVCLATDSLPQVRIGHGEPMGLTTVRNHLEWLIPGGVQRLRQAGHQRVAVLITVAPGNPAEESILDGWTRLCRQQDEHLSGRVVPWMPFAGVEDACRWAAIQPVEALLVSGSAVAAQVRTAGWSGPLAAYCANIGSSDPALAGWHLDFAGVARLAIDQLDALIRRGASAPALGRSTLLVDPLWVEG